MELQAYLDRIGFVGTPAPDLATLARIQRGHLEHIPYENLDVQLGRRVTLDPAEAFAKLVTAGRGGWCYEMNGLFRWALEAVGFRVTAMTGAVLRIERGDAAIGNHLALTVDLDEPYLVDVGLGDGPSEPIPLREGRWRQGWRTVGLERLEAGWWRFHNHERAFATSFDFRHGPADWERLAERCDWLQTSPESRFVANAVCIRHEPEGVVALVGRVMKTITEEGTADRLIDDAEGYARALSERFGIRLPQAAGLWPKISLRHDELFGPAPAAPEGS
ncbi:arylamine N-acetyltransferase [Hypericibacter adhaerens]|jgi:N-hydroxyarylamine O-acetyltransferase|uniref:Arylamine N-acetyltransferase n=1 Tax=Hypericibacter adhaerens TaxID=2602016 RepID=A0A5J6MUY2_9PROT|nr:arylamine N-acetyltransferase [Hypericibacter adhaerens]QEX20963.1 arylamine N-acetyltransferase [Hypericibacter adhaerens]